MTLKQITEDNFPSLLRSVYPSLDLLGRLTSVPFIKDRISSINQQQADIHKNYTLLNALREVPVDIQKSVMNGFISALRSSGQDHVANIFCKQSDKVIMSDEHYELLRSKRCDLCQFINARDGLTDHLSSLNILSESDSGKILSKSGLSGMAEETVNILMRKSDCTFNKFVDALNKTNQSHVSYILTGVGNLPMSEVHREQLHTKMDRLEDFTDTENGLLVRMMCQEVITDHEAEQIRSVRNHNAMARKLIEILQRKPDDAYCKFVALLCETGQSHVAYILTGEGNSRPLKEEHRKRLLSGPRDKLVKEIDSKHSGLVSALMSKGVFSSYDEQRVTSVQPDTIDDRNEMMLNLIARKSQTDFFNFISALNDTGQTHVAVELIGESVVAKIKTIYESRTNSSLIPKVDAELLEYMRKMFQSNGDIVRRLNVILSRNGAAVSCVREGCIEVTFTCNNAESLHNFQDLNDSGVLEKTLNETFCSHFAAKGLKSLKVEISRDQFDQCAQTFARWIPMTSGHREALLSSAESLVNMITVSDSLLDKLTSCKRRRQAIKSAATREQQVKTLIDIVSRQPDSAFTQLINALNDTQQTEAADIITGDSTSPAKIKESKLHRMYMYNGKLKVSL